ncbi:hypothetical protein TNCV_206221 [Trichonephila clavipes]|nr:hypothetical protein TNCV_206221 [Trichonephila clavipes]
MNLEVNWRECLLECAGVPYNVQAFRSVFVASVKPFSVSSLHISPLFGVSSIEYVKPFPVSRDAESLLFLRSRNYYCAIGPSHITLGKIRSWRSTYELNWPSLCRLDKGNSKVHLS